MVERRIPTLGREGPVGGYEDIIHRRIETAALRWRAPAIIGGDDGGPAIEQQGAVTGRDAAAGRSRRVTPLKRQLPSDAAGPLFRYASLAERQFVNQAQLEVVRDVELADGLFEPPIVLIRRRAAPSRNRNQSGSSRTRTRSERQPLANAFRVA